MSHRSPEEISLFTYSFLTFWGLLAGMANHLHRRARAAQKTVRRFELASDLCYCLFSTYMAYFLCEWKEVSEMLTIPIVGVAAHSGARFIWALDAKFFSYLDQVEANPIQSRPVKPSEEPEND